MKPSEVDPKPCDPTLDTHRGGDEGQAHRALTKSRVKREEQARLGNRQPMGRVPLPLPQGVTADGTEQPGELPGGPGVGAPFLGKRTQGHGLAPTGCLWTATVWECARPGVRASLVDQWLRLRLPVWGVWV